MKNVKKFFVSMATCAFAASLGVGFGLVNASAETISVSDLTESNVIQMQAGAEARVDGTSAESYNGLRFTMLVDDTTAKNLSGANYGMLIAPVDYVDTYGALSLDNPNYVWGSTAVGNGQAKIINVWGNELTEGKAGDGFKEFRGVIYDIQESNLDRAFVGVGYVKDGTGFKMATPADNSRSIATIAQTALNGTYASTTGDETYLAKRSVLTGWASKIAWQVDFKDDYGDVVKQQWVTKGETAGAAPEVTARDLYDFNAWTYADGTAYNAENAVTANTVVKQSWNVKPLKVTFDDANGSEQAMTFGAEKSVQLNGQKVIMSFDVEEASLTATTNSNYLVAILTASIEDLDSPAPQNSSGCSMGYHRKLNGSLFYPTGYIKGHASGGAGLTDHVTYKNGITFASLYEVGASIRIEYQPYVAETESESEIKGSIYVYKKAATASAYSLMAYMDGMTAANAADDNGLHLLFNDDVSLVLHNFKVETEDGRNLGILGHAYSNSSDTVTVEAYNPSYTVSGASAGVFGSSKAVNIADGDTLEISFDILASSIPTGGNIGFIVSGNGSWSSAYAYTAPYSFMGYINYSGTPDIVLTGTRGGSHTQTTPVCWHIHESVTDNIFTFARFLAAGTTVKVVYTPYIDENNMGKLELYQKTTGASDDTYSLRASITNLDAGYAPKTNVMIGLFSATNGLSMSINNYTIKNGERFVPNVGSKGGVTIAKVTEEATA